MIDNDNSPCLLVHLRPLAEPSRRNIPPHTSPCCPPIISSMKRQLVPQRSRPPNRTECLLRANGALMQLTDQDKRARQRKPGAQNNRNPPRQPSHNRRGVKPPLTDTCRRRGGDARLHALRQGGRFLVFDEPLLCQRSD